MSFGPGADRQRAEELLRRVGLGDRLRHLPRQLSTGQQQRVAVARGLVGAPDVLLMDEPSEGLAPAVVEHLGNSLKDLVAQGQRVLLIEQNLKFASSLCDEIVILSNGEIQATVSSVELRASSELQNKYLGVA